MRKTVVCLLVVLVLGIFLPVSLNFSLSGNKPILVTLDVCHAHSAALSGNADLPVVTEAQIVIPLDCYKAAIEVSGLQFQDLFTPFLEEDPPKA